MADQYLQGRVAWVTGGASGMGRAIALALAEAGADVAIGSLMESERDLVVPHQTVYLLSENELEATGAEIASRGAGVLARPLDVCSNVSVSGFYEAVVETFGKVDILVNAAGSSARHHMVGHPDGLWQRIIDINLSGPYRTVRLCLPGMIERGWGRVVNLASTAANVGAEAHGAYCASKSGLLGLTRCIALEGAAHGVSCNAINPSFVATPQNQIGMVQQMKIDGVAMSVEDYRVRVAEGIPQKRWVDAAEIGALAAFLCRDEAFGITMGDLTVSAGSLW